MYRLFIQDITSKDETGLVRDFQIASRADMDRIASALQPTYDDEPALEELNQSLFPALFTSPVAENPKGTALIDKIDGTTYSVDVTVSLLILFWNRTDSSTLISH